MLNTEKKWKKELKIALKFKLLQNVRTSRLSFYNPKKLSFFSSFSLKSPYMYILLRKIRARNQSLVFEEVDKSLQVNEICGNWKALVIKQQISPKGIEFWT